MRKGYITRYLNERLSMGLAAESLEGYFTQRTRWCRGALQMLFLKEGPLGPGLTLIQRLFFFPLDWLVQYPVRVVGIIVPIVFLWTGIGPFLITSLDELMSYQLPAFIALTWTMRFFAPNCYVPILSTAISFFNSLRMVPTALATMIKPFGVPFRVTPKGNNNAASAADRYALIITGVLAALTLGGLILNRLDPDRLMGGHTGLVVAEIYALVNLVILALAAVMALEVPRLRRTERFPVHHHGTFTTASEEQDVPCVLLDISESGARLASDQYLEAGSWIDVDVPGLGVLPARVVRSTKLSIAVEFSDLAEDQRHKVIEFIYSSGLNNEVRQLNLSDTFRGLLSFLLGMQPAIRQAPAVVRGPERVTPALPPKPVSYRPHRSRDSLQPVNAG